MSSREDMVMEQVAALPLEPGVYQFLDRDGKVIYVGKAKSLRKRVSSYFVKNKDHSAKVKVLVIPTDEEYMIACDTEALAKAL